MTADHDTGALTQAMFAARVVAYHCDPASGETVRSGNSIEVLGLPDHGPTEAWTEIVDPEDLPEFLNTLHSLSSSNPCFEMEYRITHAVNGRRFWVLDRGSADFDSNGRRLRVEGAIVDISARMGAEVALRKSARMSAVAFEAARMAAWHLDVASNLMTCSEEFLGLIGLEPQRFDHRLQSFERCISPPDLEIWRNFLRAASKTEGRVEIEFRVVHPNGQTRWLLCRGEYVRQADGSMREFFGIMMDITERKASEEAVSRLASIVTHSEDAILSKSMDGVVTSWNRGAEHLFGYTAQEMIGRPVMTIMPPQNASEEKHILDTIRRGETIPPYESVRLRRDGQVVHVSIAVSPIRNTRGQVTGASTIARDITERRRHTEALRQNEARLRLALRSARAGAWDIDLVRDELHWSQEMFLLYGLDPADGVPPRLDRDKRIDPAHRERVRQEYEQALQNGGSFTLEFPIWRPDGTMIWTCVVGDIVKDETGRPVSARGIDQDITERKNWEKRQAILLRELSHRVKNSLAVIQSMTRQTLRSNSDPRKFVEAFEGRISSLAASHSLLTEGNWAGARLADVIRHQLGGMVDSMEDRFTLRGPAVLLSADAATQLGLVLHELGTNAMKYGALSSPEGHIDIVWTASSRKLRLSWRERGGPPVEAPATYHGFGTSLIFSSATKVARRFAREGLTCRLEIAL